MPFGKHKGESFDEIPPDYFDWLLKQDWLSKRLRDEIEEFLAEEENDRQWRKASHQQPNGNGGPLGGKVQFTADEQESLKEMLTAGFRALAMKYHPDKGGETKDMTRINLLAEKLRQNGLIQ